MKWDIIDQQNYKQYMQEYHIHSLLAKCLDYKSIPLSDVKNRLSNHLKYHDFSLFLDGDLAVDRIEEAIENEEKICIYGDYDCDGILATAILVQAFLERGIKVGYHIPHRREDGYGLNVRRVKQMEEKGYSLIITVDNGIKAYEALSYAENAGIDVIVVDHHSYEDLPDACAIIHTKMSPEYPFKEICGGFLAYKLASQLLGRHDKYLFCLAAVTTISDMMPLIDENRSLVKRALQFMQEEKYLQLELLLGENQTYSATNIGFIIAPKINSFGRLPEIVNPIHLVRYFLKNVDEVFAAKIADAAKKINAKRQDLTTKQYKKVLESLDSEDFLFVYDQDIHEGIVGLVAGKYTREYQRPSFVMNYDERTNRFKGSARSVENIPLTQIFHDLSNYFVEPGGHALAGGFSVEVNMVDKLHQALKEYMSSHTFDEPTKRAVRITLDEISLASIEELSLLEPYGQGNEEVIFCIENISQFTLRELSNGKHARFDIDLVQGQLSALLFNCGNRLLELKSKNVLTLIGKLKVDTYMGNKQIKMMIDTIM